MFLKFYLFFSYNDVSKIDRVLLDRIHRIKFEHLNEKEKLVVAKNYIVPEVLKKMGLTDTIIFDDNILQFIINKYTYEPGVRKLKEILFEIVGEINLDLLGNKLSKKLPLKITKKDIEFKYLKNRISVKIKQIPSCDKVGIVNGLWANAMGQGGIIPIETSSFLATNNLELKLTGMQGDVMKESMNVAKTLAWNLLEEEKQKEWLKNHEKPNICGIHIHCPEGATPKDGPSAGAAITLVLYSFLTNKKIKHTIAMTGEINLQGDVTAIGGLDLKILGGIKGGVKEFLYPKENEKDFEKFLEKYKGEKILNGISFNSISNINEVLKYAIVN